MSLYLVYALPQTIGGTSGNNTLYGAGANDTIYGYGGDDRIYGYSGDDRIYGGDGKDRIYGGNGNDTIYGGNGNDTIYGEDGNDLIYGEDGSDWISGGDGNDSLVGGNGNDTIYGGNGNDNIFTGNGNDTIYGGNGNDFLVGGRGNDLMTGGAGIDTFGISPYDDGVDRIKDFDYQGVDADKIKIYLTDYDINRIVWDGDFNFYEPATEEQKAHIIDKILIAEQVGSDLVLRMGNTGSVLDNQPFAVLEGLGGVAKDALDISIVTNPGNPNGYASWGF